MTIALPTSPSPAQFTPRLVSFSNDLQPPLGGDIQRILRLGDKMAADIVMPMMERGQAEAWFAQLMQGTRDTVLLNWPQPYGGVGNPGTPLVQGGGQTGGTLAIDGLTAGYAIPAGRWFSLVTAGRRYMHMALTAVTANGLGQASLAILPLLRVVPADNAVIEMAQPKIEGLIKRDELQFPMSGPQHVALKFSITEQK